MTCLVEELCHHCNIEIHVLCDGPMFCACLCQDDNNEPDYIVSVIQ